MYHLKLESNRIRLLCMAHICLITLSNLLVQYPFELLDFHTTWGAFTYPAIFILTDLTVRLSSAANARVIIFRSMLPGLFLSYFIASYLEQPQVFSFWPLHVMPLRIALACFIAYVVGQILDIFIFQRFRSNNNWWLAPVLSASFGNLVDTFLFFAVAFYHCSNPFMNQHWPEIALVDMVFKMIISCIAFVPLYGIVIKFWGLKITRPISVN